MNTRDAAATLLTGSLAVRMGYLSSDDLSAAFRIWSDDDSSSIEEILAREFRLSDSAISSLFEAKEEWLDSHQSNWDGDLGMIDVPEELRGAAQALLSRSEREADPNCTLPGGKPIDPSATQVLPREVSSGGPASASVDATVELPSDYKAADHPGGGGGGGGAETIATTLPPGAETVSIPGLSRPTETSLEDTVAHTGQPFPSDADITVENQSGSGMERTHHFPAAGSRETALTAPGDCRYQKLRPHAKGGLGEVFLAFDQELRREVALKQIQDRFADNLESRSRFITEAEVTGGLEHPGIVPVYGFGRGKDGRPYYAMRFIQGESLKSAIDQFHEADRTSAGREARDLEFRKLLARFIDVCESIGFAHSRGVLHRDIKPANVMLGDYGETLVVDWGLAKALDQVGEASEESGRWLKPRLSSGSETMIGSTMGTPGYMCPERAAGRHHLAGVQSDIYSLGATLYTLLTGVQPFVERNLALLLMKVQRGDFPPPSKVNKRVPKALEAICLKAMALAPLDRYQTAGELAREIEQWLADEPVSAYREPPLVRMKRWAKRHKTLVSTAAALLIMTTLALGVGAFLIKREQARTERNFLLAQTAVDTMLTELGEVELAEVPQMEPVRRRMLEKALSFYKKFLEDRGGDRALQRETARARVRLGDIAEMLGDSEVAEANYRKAIDELTALGPGRAAETDLAGALHNLGITLKNMYRLKEARGALEQALRLRKALAASSAATSDDVRNEQATIYRLGTIFARMPGKPGDAESLYAAAIAGQRDMVVKSRSNKEDKRKLARYLNNLGILELGSDPARAEKTFREALGIQNGLREDLESLAGFQWERARTLSNLGAAIELTSTEGGNAESSAYYAEAVEWFRKLAAAFPSVPDYKSELAASSSNYAAALRRSRKADASDRRMSAAADALSELALNFPARPGYRYLLGSTESNQALFRTEAGGAQEAMAELEKARTRLAPLVEKYPGSPEYRNAAGLVEKRAGSIAFDRQEWKRAIDLLAAAHKHFKVASEGDPKNERIRTADFGGEVVRAESARLLGDYNLSAEIAEELPQLTPDAMDGHRRAARFLAAAAALAQADASLSRTASGETFNKYAGKAIDHLKQAAKAGFADISELSAPVYSTIRDSESFLAVKSLIEANAKPRQN